MPEDEDEDEAEDKISASRTVWPRGLNITGKFVYRLTAFGIQALLLCSRPSVVRGAYVVHAGRR